MTPTSMRLLVAASIAVVGGACADPAPLPRQLESRPVSDDAARSVQVEPNPLRACPTPSFEAVVAQAEGNSAVMVPRATPPCAMGSPPFQLASVATLAPPAASGTSGPWTTRERLGLLRSALEQS